MKNLARILLGIALAAPAVAVQASPGSISVQQTIQARVAHRVVQQNDQALRREAELRRAAAKKERAPETSAAPPASPRQP